MAINTGTTARVHWGDLAALAGATAVSMAITVKPTAAPTNGYRYVGQWGTSSQAFLLYSSASDHCALAVGLNGTWLRIYRASSVSFVNGTLYRVVVRWTAGTRSININGSESAIVTDTSVGTEAALGDAADDVAAGFEAGGPTANGIPGDRSEFGLWLEYLPDSAVAAYASGYSPLQFRPKGLMYSRMMNTADIRNLFGSQAGTNSSGTNAPHPRVIYPRRRVTKFAGAGAPGALPWFPMSAGGNPPSAPNQMIPY